MKLSSYDKFPSISNDKISLREIQFSDVNDLNEISYYGFIQATTIKQASETPSNYKNYLNESNNF